MGRISGRDGAERKRPGETIMVPLMEKPKPSELTL